MPRRPSPPVKRRPARAETPMAFVRAITLAYEKYGLDPANALSRARISQAQLRRVDARIDAGQMEVISATAMQELDDEALGWFSRKLPWGTYGMLCRASLTAPSLGIALSRWCRHHRLVADGVVLRLESAGRRAHVVIEERADLGAMREFCLLTSLRYLHGYACWLTDSQLPLVEVVFPFATPRHHAVYPLLFPGPSRFAGGETRMTFDAKYLELTPRRDEDAVRTMLKRALPLTVRQYRRDRLLVERVRALLARPSPHPSTASALAAALHVSVRTLHRQLADEGSSLQALKNAVRTRRAKDLLRRTTMPIKEVARAAGFTNEKSFSRAFKDWTGLSPSEARAAEA